MSEIDDLEAYYAPGIKVGGSRKHAERPRGKRLSEAEADRIFERVKAELAKSKATAGDRK